ncbi:hypothetical protein [Candidatus Endoriftia persephonae]|jgi:putative ABC transport system ATP-binding protein|uniref:ABC-type antimicrobial peptide transport system, ATPase component n=2 Tax=Gammaproteobacteria TaxID=1236 RepID=G2FJQ8_9GAMM|nr:hypothetical protein [Candidatus Endoriftia persephone]EGW52958.1 ABC-type antimicrobial peptide transport system, ATPase component [endosymbiont of Tevnia jerichonana (vent Tica)]USF87934.1 hypothetical protein L0Y14_01400 [Candidatus Endoriftia persephone]
MSDQEPSISADEHLLIKAQAACPKHQPNGEPCLPLDLHIHRGELIFLLGEEPEALRAYLRILAAVEPISRGEILLGDAIGDAPFSLPWQQLRQSLGYVDHAIPLLSVLSGLDNLKLAAHYHQQDDEQTIALREQALLGAMQGQMDHSLLPAYMTPLQQRHLSIARALMLCPKALFAHNPFFGLSRPARQRLADFLLQRVPQLFPEISLIISTDDPELVHHYAGQVLFHSRSGWFSFHNWEDFVSSPEDVVRYYIHQQRAQRDIFSEAQ